MKQLLLLSMIILISLFSLAQKHLTPGYIIKNNGDSLRGFLQEEIKKDLVKQIKFSNEQKAAGKAFTPDEVKAFGYDQGNIYRAISFKSKVGGTVVDKTCFTRQLVHGEYDLFTYVDNDRTYFVIRGRDTSYFLYNTTYTALGSVNEQGNFFETIRILSAPCQQLNSRSDRVVYTEKDIVGFIMELNQCIEPNKPTTSYYHKPKLVTNVFVYAGGLLSGQKSQVTGDIALRLSYPQINKRAYLNIGFHLSNTLITEESLGGGYVRYKTDTRSVLFSIPVTVQYNLIQGIIQPYLFFGISGAYLRETEYRTVFTAQTELNKWGLAGLVGAGIEGHITPSFFVNAEWRLEKLLQYSPISQLPSVGLAYKF